MPLPALAQASEATWVPCPLSSEVAGPEPGSSSSLIVSRMRPANSGCVVSTPSSMTATIAPSPCVTSHSAGRFSRAAHHSIFVPAGVLNADSSVLSAGSLGGSRGVKRRSTCTECTRGSLRSRAASWARLSRARGLTVTSPICGALCPAGSALARATTARARTADAVAVVPRGWSSSTSSRPVAWPGAACADAGSNTAAAAIRNRSRCMRGWLIPQRELGILGHLVRGPRRGESHRRLNTAHALEFRHELVDLLGDLRADRASGGGQGERHVDVALVDLDAIDQAEFDEVEPELGIDDVGERVFDFLNGDHRNRV